MAGDELMDLIQCSSLGTEGARRLRARATPALLEEVRRRKADYAATQASEVRHSIDKSAACYRAADTAAARLREATAAVSDACAAFPKRDRRLIVNLGRVSHSGVRSIKIRLLKVLGTLVRTMPTPTPTQVVCAETDTPDRCGAGERILRHLAVVEAALDLYGAVLAAASVPGVTAGPAARAAGAAGGALEKLRAAARRPGYFLGEEAAADERVDAAEAVAHLSATAALVEPLQQELDKALDQLRDALQDTVYEAVAWCRSLSVDGTPALLASAATIFVGLDLEGVRLPRVDFSGINLLGVNLARADLAEAVLAGTDLTCANVADARIAGAIWSMATVWPAGYGEHVMARSEEVGDGVFRVRDGGEQVPWDVALAT